MRGGGVQVQEALPGGLLRTPLVRYDLRLHRKVVVIDGRVAYTGSLNMVDPRSFKQDAGVGEWVDSMVRLEGPVVEALQRTFLGDWFMETGATLEGLIMEPRQIGRMDLALELDRDYEHPNGDVFHLDVLQFDEEFGGDEPVGGQRYELDFNVLSIVPKGSAVDGWSWDSSKPGQVCLEGDLEKSVGDRIEILLVESN